MSFWNIFGVFATSSKGETITKVSDTTSVSSRGVSYTTIEDMTLGSDGSSFVQMGDFSSDGSTRLDSNTATGLGAVFNKAPYGSSALGGNTDNDFGFKQDTW